VRKLANIFEHLPMSIFMTCILGVVAIIVALYLYRPQLRQIRFGSIIVLSIIIIGSAGFKVFASYNHSDKVNNDILEQYKLADWVIHAEQPTSSLYVKHAWQKNPTLENKLFYTFALIKNNNFSRGKHLLEELIDGTSEQLEWLDEAALQTLLNNIESYDDEELAEASREDHVPEFADVIDQEIEAFKQHVASTIQLDEQSLQLVTQFDIDRVQSLAASGDDEALYDIQDQLGRTLDDMGETNESPLLKKEIAKVAYFIGDSHRAEEILVDVVLKSPTDQEAIGLLSDIYLSGDVTPSEETKKLPQYHHAELLTAREKMQSFQEWKDQVDLEDTLAQSDSESNASESKREEDERPDYLFDSGDLLANEMTYTLIQSMDEPSEDPEMSIRLSRYHFNKGKNDEAKQQIQDVLKNSEHLSTEEQYIINTIEYHDQKLKQSIDTSSFMERQTHLQEIYHSKEDLFNNFHMPSLESSPNIADQSYEHFLTESIRHPQDKNVSIMTIDADESGSVTMYVNTENVDSIDKEKFNITDNDDQIEDFTIDKIGENLEEDTFDRSIGLVIDVSGSMEGERIKVARNSSKAFVHRIKDFEQAELVKFESNPTLVQAFTDKKRSLIDGINALTSGGGTNITDALLYEMDRIKDEDGHKVIFIFSDGEDDNFSRVESRTQIIDLANAYGISIFAVGFGAGYETLSEVASETGGMYIAAPNEATIDEGFKHVEQALEDTYKVNYKLADPTKGKHLVKIDYQGLTDKKHYFLGEDDQDLELDPSDFEVFQMSPSTIYQTNEEYVKATLSGKNMDDLASVTIGNEDIKIEKVSNDETVDILIPGDLTLGQHILVAKSKDNEQSEIEFTVSKADPKDEIPFGWATLYGDMCQTDGNQIKCMGDPSIDHFIYPESSKMTLTDDETLDFNGARFNIDQAKLTFFKNDLGSSQTTMDGDMTLTKADDHGEKFSLAYEGRDQLSINKLGIEVELNNMTYTAHPEKQPGTFTSESKLNSIPDEVIDIANVEGYKVLNTLAPFLSTDFGLALTISPSEANIKGSVDLGDIGLLGIKMKNPLSAVEYDDLNKRFAIEGEFGNFSFLGKKIDAVIPIKSAQYSLGYEPGFKFKLGLTLKGNYPLGTTGLSLTKIGGHIDWTSRREAGLEAALGTVANEPVKELIRQVNSIKIATFQPFNIDPKSGDILALEVDGGVSNAFTSNWEATGTATGKVLGFEVLELAGRINNYLLQSSLEISKVANLKGEATIIYEDPNYHRYLTANTDASITKKLPLGVELKGELHTRFVPANIRRSEIRLVGKAGPFDFSITTDDLDLFN